MKKIKNERPQKTYLLGDLIAAVSAASSNELEMVAAVKDLFAKGIVQLESPTAVPVKR